MGCRMKVLPLRRIGATENANFWTSGDVFCNRCDGEGEAFGMGVLAQCGHCRGTGYEAIPFTELFPDLRRGEPEKYPL
jgi:hypothetical protein